ncbi:hypothetical protein G3570_03055 [Balneolaceae bacterium YR4-1]|uniref:Uncharacterized protein n=1 Tax=Halalkalibaculum roseum TaxID=2709311 RepID=A0A6M1T0H8_9BACT|nr:hypothetical protein [Halalkalibaculum roseum]NGP75595.1 hypothetical protein [Halalkalibaculum roseum]
MSLVIQLESKQKELAPTGLQPAAAVDVIDLGVQDTPFGEKHQVSIIFELEATSRDGEHFILSKRYSKSLHPKSNLRADLDRWRGQPFSDEDLQEGFDLNKIVGQPCMLYLEKRDNFIAIESILPTDPERVHRPTGQYTRVKDR